MAGHSPPLAAPRKFRQGQAYRAPGAPGIWVVEAIYMGPAVIFADDNDPKPTLVGFMHLANRDLELRMVARLDDPRMNRLERAKALDDGHDER